MNFNFAVTQGLDGTRLDEFLAVKFLRHSKGYLKKLVEEGLVRLNEKRTTWSQFVYAGDTITVSFSLPLEPSAFCLEPSAFFGRIELPIGEIKPGRMKIDHSHGKPSLTEFKVVEQFKGFALLSIFPRTGRTHQIRVHMKAIGHPLSVDPIYGRRNALYLSELKKNYKPKDDAEEQPLISRLTLHASKLTLNLPSDGKRLTIEAPIPKDLKIVMKTMRRYKAKT